MGRGDWSEEFAPVFPGREGDAPSEFRDGGPRELLFGRDLPQRLNPANSSSGVFSDRSAVSLRISDLPTMRPRGLAVLAIGFVVSFVVAYGVVAWFMKWVRHRGFVPFAIYRLIVGTSVVIWALNGAK